MSSILTGSTTLFGVPTAANSRCIVSYKDAILSRLWEERTMHVHTRLRHWGLCTIAGLLAATAAHAAVITESEIPPDLFGTLDQANTNCPNVNCGPTAATNSFVYLQNAFPNNYKKPLVPTANGRNPTQAEQAAVANNLGTNFMKNCCATANEGTAIGDFILGEQDYIESVDPGVTRYEAQILGRWERVIPNHPDAAKPGYVQDRTNPTLAFIARQLRAKEDVEVLLEGNDSVSHYLTLTGISYDDTNNMGTLSYVDPAGGGRAMSNILGLDAQMLIETNYQLGGANSDIVGVVAESPIPEPAGLGLLAIACAVLPALARRRRTA